MGAHLVILGVQEAKASNYDMMCSNDWLEV